MRTGELFPAEPPDKGFMNLMLRLHTDLFLGLPGYLFLGFMGLLLMVAIGGFVAFGNETVEALFKWVSILLYGTYALFVVLVLARFGEPAMATLATPHPTTGWLQGGLTYAGYNIVGAVVVLPLVVNRLRSRMVRLLPDFAKIRLNHS